MKFIFVDGTELDLPHIDEQAGAHVVGMTNKFGGVHLVGCEESISMFYPLTFCCVASGKGAGEEGYEFLVVCRSCYRDVDDLYGDIVEEQDVVRIATKKDFVLRA